MLTLFQSLVRSKLEYCSEIWSPCKIKYIVCLEKIQRTFTYKIEGMDKFSYWERLQELKIMSLQRRRERNIILHLWKILNGMNPNSVNMEFKEHKRSKAIRAIVKPLPKLRGKILSQYDDSFLIGSAKLWNVIPPKLTCITALEVFKVELDKFLLTVPDRPPLPGYPYDSDNSLTSVCV